MKRLFCSVIIQNEITKFIPFESIMVKGKMTKGIKIVKKF